MQKIFWGDSLKRWIVRLSCFSLLPIGLPLALAWYRDGYGSGVELRLKAFAVALFLAIIFLIVAAAKARPTSKRKQKHNAKRGRAS